MGARPMKRLLRKEIEDPLSMELLSNAGKDYNTVSIECNNGKIKVKLEKLEYNNSHTELVSTSAIKIQKQIRNDQ